MYVLLSAYGSRGGIELMEELAVRSRARWARLAVTPAWMPTDFAVTLARAGLPLVRVASGKMLAILTGGWQ